MRHETIREYISLHINTLHRFFVPICQHAQIQCSMLLMSVWIASSLLLLCASASVVDADRRNNDTVANAIEGADFHFVLANLAVDSAYIKYGSVKILSGGQIDARFWTGDAREPIPARTNVGSLSPTVEIQVESEHRDRGAKVLSHPAAFRGDARHVSGNWWAHEDGLCIRFDEPFALFFKSMGRVQESKWGRILTNQDKSSACEIRTGASVSASAPDSVVGVLSERVFAQPTPTMTVAYQPFDGLISRLNGWDKQCEVFKWKHTMLNFNRDNFRSAGNNVWRSITMEPQAKGAAMAVFAYLAISHTLVPHVGPVVLINVGHDFNRNGRIDDDWGHIYAGFPILSSMGDLGGLLMFDYSPVGIQEAPFTGGCLASTGIQLTHTLGLILYLPTHPPK